MSGKYNHEALNKKIPDSNTERQMMAVGMMKMASFMNKAVERGEWSNDAPDHLKEVPHEYAEPMSHVFLVQAERLTHKYDEEEYTYMGDLLEDWEMRIALEFRKNFL